MKKLILTAAAAMMVLASCTKTNVEHLNGPQEITFRKIDGAMTKTTPDASLGSTMGVFAFLNKTTNLYFDNSSFAQDGSTGIWKGDKYWPFQNNLDFVVYAPYIANTSGEDQIAYDSATKKLTFIIKDNTSSQTDYLYGAAYYDNSDTKEDKGYNRENVPVKLHHALAKITIILDVKAKDIITIKDFKLKNIYHNGEIAVTYDSSSDSAGEPDCTPGSTSADFDITGFEVKLSEDEYSQSILAFPNTDRTSITISYRMEGMKDGASDLTATINLNSGSDKWISGKHYIYTITLSPDEISFTPTYDNDWDSNEETLTPTI